MTGNYDNIHGVQYRRFGPDHEDGSDPTVEESVKLDEMYYQDGRLHITFAGTSDGFLSFDVPIYPVARWKDHVVSLVKTL